MPETQETNIWENPPPGPDFRIRLPEVPSQEDLDAATEPSLDGALRAVVHDSLLPITSGISVLYLIHMFTHLIFVSMPYAVYVSLLAAASSVGAMLLRLLLASLSPEHRGMHAVSGIVGGVVLLNTLLMQSITENLGLTEMTLLVVGSGFIFMSRAWFIGFLSTSVTAWLILSLWMYPASQVLIPSISILGAAAFGTMIHVVRRRTHLRAERLRLLGENQKSALRKALDAEATQRQSLTQSEKALREALDDLRSAKLSLEDREARLSNMVDALTEAKEKAEHSSQLKSAMLANMSHEVRTPLTAITGFSQVLQEETEGQSQHFASLIYKSSQRLMSTLDSVLRLSRLEAGKLQVENERVDLVAEAEAIALEQSNRAEDAGVLFNIDARCQTCECMVDEGAIQRILRNLVGNAIKFTESGGHVTLRVGKTAHPPTDADAVKKGWQRHVVDGDAPGATHAVLEIEDDGIGMSETFQSEMFEAFQQESQGLSRSHEGSGLGLSITRRLVDLLGGDIYVRSAKGEGTTFTLYFELAPDASPSTEDASPRDPSASIRSSNGSAASPQTPSNGRTASETSRPAAVSLHSNGSSNPNGSSRSNDEASKQTETCAEADV